MSQMKGPARSPVTMKAALLLVISILMIQPALGGSPVTRIYQEGDFISIFFKPFEDNTPGDFNLFFQGFVSTSSKTTGLPDVLTIALVKDPVRFGAFYTVDVPLQSTNAQFTVAQGSKGGGSLKVVSIVLPGTPDITITADLKWTCNDVAFSNNCANNHIISTTFTFLRIIGRSCDDPVVSGVVQVDTTPYFGNPFSSPPMMTFLAGHFKSANLTMTKP